MPLQLATVLTLLALRRRRSGIDREASRYQAGGVDRIVVAERFLASH